MGKSINLLIRIRRKMQEDVKEKILEVASEILFKEGFTGLRMQTLADKAGINKGLLHYYFKNKQNILYAVMSKYFNWFMGHIKEVLLEEHLSFQEQVERIVKIYIDVLTKEPNLPIFLVSELRRDPELLIHFPLLPSLKRNFVLLRNRMRQSGYKVETGVLPQFMINLVSLTIFPFMVKPIVQDLLLADIEKSKTFMQNRPKEVAQIVIGTLQKA